jgi:uroporphyrinogen-III synthase
VKRVTQKINLLNYKKKVFAIGPKTKNMLKRYNLDVSVGERYNSEGLAEHIIDNLDEGSKILIFRSSAATDVLRNKLSGRYKVIEKYVYDIKRLPADPKKVKKGDAVFVASASCAKSLAKLDPMVFEGKTIVSIGPETSRHLPFPHIIASTHTLQGMIDTYLDYLWRGCI